MALNSIPKCQFFIRIAWVDFMDIRSYIKPVTK